MVDEVFKMPIETVCQRCGRTPREFDTFTPLELDWKWDASVSTHTAETRGYTFKVVNDQNVSQWSVSRDGRTIKDLTTAPLEMAYVEIDIHQWYTQRFHRFCDLKEEFGNFETLDWGVPNQCGRRIEE